METAPPPPYYAGKERPGGAKRNMRQPELQTQWDLRLVVCDITDEYVQGTGHAHTTAPGRSEREGTSSLFRTLSSLLSASTAAVLEVRFRQFGHGEVSLVLIRYSGDY